MRITHADVWKVVVPCRADVLERDGRWYDPGLSTFDRIPKWIVRLHTDTGLTGLGESSRGEPEAAIRAGIEALVGQDPRRFSLARLPLPPGASYTTLEMAVFDLLGKAWEVPVATLLGGARQPRVLVDYWASRRSPEETARQAKRGQELGFHGIKIKVALAHPLARHGAAPGERTTSLGDASERHAVTADDPVVQRVAAIRAACGPDFTITIDPNCRFYEPARAAAIARELEPYRILVLEDPIPWQNRWEAYRLLRRKTTVPLAIHVSSPDAVLEAIRHDAVDYLNLNGSLVDFVRMAYLAEQAGIRCWHGSGVDLGIRDMAYLHAAIAAPNCTLPSDLVGNFLREDDLIVEPIPIEDGFARLPERPGLGVELDEEALARYAVD